MNRLPFDLKTLGRTWGWKPTHAMNVPAVTEALLAGDPVAVVQEVGPRTWLGPLANLPKSLRLCARWPDEFAELRGLIVISDRTLPELPGDLAARVAAYRPPTWALGVACFRGLSPDELQAGFSRLCASAGLAAESLMALGAPACRKAEPALHEFAEQHDLPFLAYPPEKLALLGPPGMRQRKVAGWCEAAAMLAAGGVKQVTAPKQVFARVALAAARRKPA